MSDINKFDGFKMMSKRQSLKDSNYHVTITTSYISFSPTAMKQLKVNLNDKVAVAAIDVEEGIGHKLLLAASLSDKAYKVRQNAGTKMKVPTIFITIGKQHPELKGNYYLKRYGSHNSHEWWEVVKSKPEEETERKFKFF